MKKPIIALVLAAVSLAACGRVHAQNEGPPAQVRSQIQQIRSDAKTAAFNALSADHRSRVQSIIDQFNSGSLDRDTAASQIDGVLTPSESQAVLAQQTKMRDALRAAFAQSGQSGSTGQGGWHRPGGARGTHRPPDAGRTLLMLGANNQGNQH